MRTLILRLLSDPRCCLAGSGFVMDEDPVSDMLIASRRLLLETLADTQEVGKCIVTQ